MADITLYKPAALTVSVIDGNPPVDQSALVASLTSQLTSANSQISTLTTQLATANSKIAAAQAALA